MLISIFMASVQPSEGEGIESGVCLDIQFTSRILDFIRIRQSSCSGQCYDRQQTVTALKMESDNAQIFSENFKLTMIAEGVALLRYQNYQLDADGKAIRQTERLSIWLLSALEENYDQWQMRFHQGTAIDKPGTRMAKQKV